MAEYDEAQLSALINRFAAEFDTMRQERHEAGQEKYGSGKFLNVDTMQEALYELADLANYACYTFIRIRLLQEQIIIENRPDFMKDLNT